ncbi:uncharacterized protein LOC122651135 [Telopea speciosissima]|uniref:uncharacterized protein LOC122651135 n=1 Tax=Telopea speciosissima TaxID=54955 RepID=UPI001CC80681|nr:uncharacterized protein LOC122651135 [Telopea speciosissima]
MDSEGVLCELFSRLPAKSVLRFRAVSKTCSSFPSENFFIRKHSEQALFMDNPGFFIQQDFRWGKIELHRLPPPKKNKDGEKKSFDDDNDYGVPNTSLRFLSNTAKILGSYNGILVLKNTNEEHNKGLFLCNPATQKCFTIPNPTTTNSDNHYSTVVLLGIHILSHHHDTVGRGATIEEEFPDNYRVIMVKPEVEDWSSNSSIYVYTKGQEAWEEMDKFNTGARNILYDAPPVYCKGAIHLISDTFPYLTKASPDYKPYIVAYHIHNRTSWRLKLPKVALRRSPDPSCEMRIFKWGGGNSSSSSSLCLIRLRKSVFMGWVLEDYHDMGSSWTLVLKARVGAMALMEEEQNPVEVRGFTVINGDSLVFATQKRIYHYRLTLSSGGGGRPTRQLLVEGAEEICGHGLGEDARYLCLTGYANTLRPCGSEEHPLMPPLINKGVEERVVDDEKLSPTVLVLLYTNPNPWRLFFSFLLSLFSIVLPLLMSWVFAERQR